VVNGAAMAAGTTITLTAAQLAQTSFVAGTAGANDDLSVTASDGLAFSSHGEFHVKVNRAPVLTTHPPIVAATAAQSFAATSLFAATDADNDPLTYYVLDNTTDPSSGHFVVNGAVMAAGSVTTLTAAQFAQTSFVAGAAGANDDLLVTATMASLSPPCELHVKVNRAPVLTAPAATVVATAGQSIAASNLFAPTDADNDPLTIISSTTPPTPAAATSWSMAR